MYWLNQSLRFFRREKKYAVMFAVVVLFLAVSFFYHSLKGQETSRFDENGLHSLRLQEVEGLMQKNSEDELFMKAKFREHPMLEFFATVFTVTAEVAVLIGIILNIVLARKFAKKKPLLPKQSFHPRILWGFTEFAKVVILFLFSAVCVNAIFYALKHWFSLNPHSNITMMADTTVTDVFALVMIFYFINKKQGNPWRAFGLNRVRALLREIWIGIKAYFVILPWFLVVMLVLLVVSNWMSYEPPPHPLVQMFVEDQKQMPWFVIFSLFIACFLGPVIEEIFFRGFLYPVIRRHGGIWWATVVTSAFFAAVHQNWFAFVPVFLLGVVLAYLYEKRGSLISSISMHVFHNTVFVCYFFLIKSVFLKG